MKRALITALLFVAFSSIYAQCKYKKDETDKFTGERIRETNKFMLVNRSDFRIDVIGVSVDTSIFLSVEFIYEYDFLIETGSKLLFAMDDGSVVELECVKTSPIEKIKRAATYKAPDPVVDAMMRIGHNKMMLTYSITDSAKNKLSTNNVGSCRMELFNKNLDTHIRKGYQEAVKKVVRCI